MKTNRTELVFILDKSGSMAGLEADTIGGFNSLLKKQKAEPGEAAVTTVLFDNNYVLLHDRFDIKGIRPITSAEYYVEGTTALLDAVGRTIQKIISVQRNSSDEMRAGKVMFVIITDGMENASREYSYERIKAMIELERDKYGWEFIFLGANIDAEAVADEFGIKRDNAVNYHADSRGVELNYKAVGDAVSSIRQGHKLTREWKEELEKDFENRK
ncbi:MAG: VWA domain-containing protein [Clostridia bacterium]